MATTKKPPAKSVKTHAANKFTKKTTKRTPKLTAAQKAAALERAVQADKAAAEPTTNRPKLPSAFKLSRSAVMLLWQHRWLFLGITAIYAILNVLLVRGFSGSTDVSSIKSLITGQYHGGIGKLFSGLAVFGVLVASPSGSNTASDAAGVYQTILVVIVSLALVWALRQIMAGHTIRVRDAFYLGMTPLIPVLLIVLLLTLQLVPLAVGAGTFSVVLANGIAATWWQDVLWGIGCAALASLSLYWICSSLMALYIATITDMTPMSALRSAKKLVQYRRWPILRKLLFLPFALLVVTAVIVLPIIYIATPVAPWVVYILSMFVIAVVHTYIYMLYRELLV